MATYAELPESMKQDVLVHLKSDNFVMAKKLLEAYKMMILDQDPTSPSGAASECELAAS